MNPNQPFRDSAIAKRLLQELQHLAIKPVVIMEICGGQTHALLASGIDQLLSPTVELVHGPGCPVCVTPLEMIDKAIALAGSAQVIFTTFGDMLRVPGSHSDLYVAKSKGSDIRILYSPLDAVELAKQNPDKKVIFWAIGFETTAPATAMAVWLANQQGIKNFFLLVSHVLVAPAMRLMLASPENRVQAFLAAGHVCTVMGWQSYQAIAKDYHVPIVVTGFEPVDLLLGLQQAMLQINAGRAEVVNAYGRAVHKHGNLAAQERMEQIFVPCDRQWRGLGVIPGGGLRLRDEFADFDAERMFPLPDLNSEESAECISGLILQGLKKPSHCPSFSNMCTPEHPLGAPMVSAEGACSAYFHYKIRSVASIQ